MESDFSRFSKLKDICEVEISQELSPAEKKKEYIRQTGSSTAHKVNVIKLRRSKNSHRIRKDLATIFMNTM